jgi:hypothetical protein
MIVLVVRLHAVAIVMFVCCVVKSERLKLN